MKLKVVISLSTARSKQLHAPLYGEHVIIYFIKELFSLSCSLTPRTDTCQLVPIFSSLHSFGFTLLWFVPSGTTGPLILHKMKKAKDSRNQSTFIYLLLYHSMHPYSMPYCMAADSGGDERCLMKSLLGIILWSKCKFRKGVKALRKLLPTWLALMNSSQRLRQNTKVEDCIHVIKIINYSFICIPSFLTPHSTSSNHRRCVRKPCYCSLESVVNCGCWQKHGEPICSQCRCSEAKTIHLGKAKMYTGNRCMM